MSDSLSTPEIKDAVSATETTEDRVLTLPGLQSPGNKVEGVQFAGYMPVTGAANPEANDAKLFYWFVGTDDYAARPTIIWTNGGPGSSSFWGFFLENGPYVIEYPEGGEPKVTKRDTAWNQFANYMIFEHPLSVTMSFAQDEEVPKTVEQGMEQYYQAFLNFLALHPEIAKNPIILAGESYAGTYLPLLAKLIVEGNANSGGTKINLAGTVLLDAWVDPWTQMATDTTYALMHGLISASQKEVLDQNVSLPNVNSVIGTISGVYMANIAEQGDPPFEPVMRYLNNDEFRKAVHAPLVVDPYTLVTQNWSAVVSDNYTPRVNESFAGVVRDLLEGTIVPNGTPQKVIVISGLNDAKDCNFIGTGEWLNKLDGAAAAQFKMAETKQWNPTGKQVLGFEQNGGTLRWLKVLNAGHLAVLDQPQLIHYILDAVKQ